MNFNNLTAKQLIEGINLTIKNAQSLFQIANFSKLSGNLGLAKALYILSCEEAIKAFAIYNLFLIDDNRDISPIFRSHKEKLTILKEGYRIMSSETMAMDKSFKQAMKEQPNGSKEEIEKRATVLYRKNMEEIYLGFNEEKVKNDKDWWDEANINKQRGFYVGFQNNNWITPQDTSEAEVNEAREKALMIIGHIIAYKDVQESKYKTEKEEKN